MQHTQATVGRNGLWYSYGFLPTNSKSHSSFNRKIHAQSMLNYLSRTLDSVFGLAFVPSDCQCAFLVTSRHNCWLKATYDFGLFSHGYRFVGLIATDIASMRWRTNKITSLFDTKPFLPRQSNCAPPEHCASTLANFWKSGLICDTLVVTWSARCHARSIVPRSESPACVILILCISLRNGPQRLLVTRCQPLNGHPRRHPVTIRR